MGGCIGVLTVTSSEYFEQGGGRVGVECRMQIVQTEVAVAQCTGGNQEGGKLP